MRDILRKLVGNSDSRSRSPVKGGKGKAASSAAQQPFGFSTGFHYSGFEGFAGLGDNRRLAMLASTFSPSNPVSDLKLFAGRQRAIGQIISAIEDKHNHVMLYGPRGVGKTSIAMYVKQAAEHSDYMTVYVSCSRSSSFAGLFKSVVRKIPIRYHADFNPGDEDVDPGTSFADLLENGEWSPQSVGELLAEFSGTRLLIVFDEFDRLSDDNTADVAELLKNLSDHNAAVHLMMIGIRSRSEEMLAEQLSTARTLFAMRIDAMRDEEISDLLERSCESVGLSVEASALGRLIKLSHGKPFLARIVAMSAAREALLRNSSTVANSDLTRGLGELWQYLSSIGIASQVTNAVMSDETEKLPVEELLAILRVQGDEFTPGSSEGAGLHKLIGALTKTNPPILSRGKTTKGLEFYLLNDPRAEVALAVFNDVFSLKRSAAI